MLRPLLVLLSLLAAVAATAAPAQTIRVLTSTDLDPMARGPDADPPGFHSELIVLLAERAGLDLVIDYLPWDRAQHEVAQGADAYLMAPTRNARREDLYDWIVPMLSVGQVFLTTGPAVDDMETARLLGTIAVRGSYERTLQGLEFDNLRHVPSVNSFRMLRAGRVDAVFTLRERAAYIWRDLGYPAEALVIGTPIKEAELWLAGPKGSDPEVAARLRDAMDALRADGSYGALRSRYFGPEVTVQSASRD